MPYFALRKAGEIRTLVGDKSPSSLQGKLILYHLPHLLRPGQNEDLEPECKPRQRVNLFEDTQKEENSGSAGEEDREPE